MKDSPLVTKQEALVLLKEKIEKSPIDAPVSITYLFVGENERMDRYDAKFTAEDKVTAVANVSDAINFSLERLGVPEDTKFHLALY